MSTDDPASLTLFDGESSLTLFVVERAIAGDDMARTILATFNFVRSIGGSSKGRRDFVLDVIKRCRTIVRAKAAPELTLEFSELIFNLAGVVDGLVFNGSEMLDAKGRTVLAADGSFEDF